MPISRRDILKSLTLTAITGSVLRIIPAEAAEYAHRMVREAKATDENQVYAPKFFSRSLLQDLADALPDDYSRRRSGQGSD